MTPLKPGSVAWLLAHELKITYRGVFPGKRVKGAPKTSGGMGGAWLIGIGFLFILGLTLGVPAAITLGRAGVEVGPMTYLAVDVAMIFVWTLMLSQALTLATVAFYDRADLDLLLTSPLPPDKILAVRVAAIAGSVLALVSVLVSPFLIPAAIFAHWPWIAAYPVIVGLGLLASVAGVWLAMGLFALLGARRTRTVAQIVAALAGAAIFLLTQVYTVLGKGGRGGMIDQLQAAAAAGVFDRDAVLAWPARAALGDPLPLAVFVSTCLVLFVVTAKGLGRKFAENAAAASTIIHPARPQRGGGRVRFADGAFTALVRKEMRLLLRDPTVLSQFLMQILYLSPLALLLLRDAQADQTVAVAIGAGAMAFLSGQLAGSLGWITISAEDSPELLATSPVAPARLRKAKLFAAIAPVMVILALPLLALGVISPWAGLMALLGCLATCVSCVFVELWRQRPGKRTEFRRRRGSAVFVPLCEVFIGLLFGAAAGLAVAGKVWALAPLLLGFAFVMMLRPGARTREAMAGVIR